VAARANSRRAAKLLLLPLLHQISLNLARPNWRRRPQSERASSMAN